MPSKLLMQEMDGTPKQIVFADHANDFSPTAANDLRITTDGSFELDVALQMASVANNAARQSAKCDLGAERAPAYKVRAALEWAATPAAGSTVEFYWAPSHSATAGTGNAGGVSGSNSAYAGYSANLDASVRQLDFIGYMLTTTQATGTVQIAEVGIFSPSSRYGSLIVYNKGGAAIHSDDVECNIVFDPILPENQ